MLAILVAIAPIFVMIVAGYGLRRGGIPSVEFWNLNDRLVYWVLMPALLFSKVSTMSFSILQLSHYAMVILSGLFTALLFALLSARCWRMSAAVGTSLLQGVGRHNAFIALAVAEALFGAEGLALALLVTAIFIPATNVAVVALMVTLLNKDGRQGMWRNIGLDLIRNPLLLAVALGFVFNAVGWQQVPVLHEVCRIMGAAALPIVLLCVGANIRVRAMAAAWWPIALSIMGKMLLFPLVILAVALWLDLSTMEIQVVILFGAVPTAASSYTLARQMGGDAPLMAAIITLQTALSFVTLPLTVLWVQTLLA